jgi:hypothetical protein
VVSTQDFAHGVWQSLEGIRERLAVVETEVRHTRRDLLRLETSLHSHVADHRRPSAAQGAYAEGANGATINIRISRKALGSGGVVGGSLLAAIAAVGRLLGWW